MTNRKEKPEIPLHTKWGIRITAVIILLITVTVIKNCIGSFRYGISTDQEQQKIFYELGYSHGMHKAKGLEGDPEPETENLLLRKLYRKGYRDGWDSVEAGRMTDSSGPDKQNSDND
jgi:hypothetical protein